VAAALSSRHSVPTFLRRPANQKGNQSMLRTLIAVIGLSLAAPAFAQQTPIQKDMNDASKDVGDSSKDALDKTKDVLGTDSGAAKAKRHADRAARKTTKKARHVKHNVRKEVEAKTNQ
jgi:hypothetical protein